MSTRKIPFGRPCFDDEDLDEIASGIKTVLRSGWLTSGPTVHQFEKEFAEFVGVDYAVAVNSCTAALHSILLAYGIGKGDEVIVPTNTFVATANAALYVGAKPILADSDPETFNVSAKEIEQRISKNTRAISVVHLGGNPCDMDQISRIANDHNLILIEDCAHAHGAKYKNRSCGTIGNVGAFSFYPTKIMTTGEGGMVTTNDKELAEKIMSIRNIGRASFGPSEIINLGFNFRMSDINAFIGLTQLKHVPEYVKNRNTLASLYAGQLSGISWLRPQKLTEGSFSSYYVYIVKVEENSPISRDQLVARLKEMGIGTSILYNPVHLQPLYVKLFGFERGMLPIAEDLGERTLALPMYSCMTPEDVNYVISIIKQVSQEA